MKVISKNKNNPKKPFISFQKNKHITFFTSFESMNEADAKKMAALSPKEHLQNTVFLIRKLFAKELKRPMDKKIKFR